MFLVFDWGGTLMKMFPQYSGAMVDWPQVAAVEGIKETLAAFHRHHNLIVGTNAADSQPEQVRAALARVGLDTYFDAVYTFKITGHRKPEPGFYHAVASLTGASPNELVMIGDEYLNDIYGASAAGWRAYWYNPSAQPANAHIPHQSGDLSTMPELIDKLSEPVLPGYQECIRWLLETGTPYAILQHVHSVAAVAYQLALWLRMQGHKVDPVLTHRGGLLHDLGKYYDIRHPEDRRDHGQVAEDILNGKGQPVLARIARRHMLFNLLDPRYRAESWEEKLVFFADKLVEGSGIVPLEERMVALQQRYTIDPAKLEATLPALAELQAELSQGLGTPQPVWWASLKAALQGRN